jgi:hypothetical protein
MCYAVSTISIHDIFMSWLICCLCLSSSKKQKRQGGDVYCWGWSALSLVVCLFHMCDTINEMTQ